MKSNMILILYQWSNVGKRKKKNSTSTSNSATEHKTS